MKIQKNCPTKVFRFLFCFEEIECRSQVPHAVVVYVTHAFSQGTTLWGKALTLIKAVMGLISFVDSK